MRTAEIILEQLGGQRFVAMTGARNFLGDETMIQFSLPGGGFAKDGINKVRIELDPSDTYTVRFLVVRGASVRTIHEVEGVYDDMLQDIFESHTGLRVSL